MSKSAVIRHVLEWIEAHLEQPLDVELIAKQSGYGKRAFHDIFKSVTGYNVATYVRHRKLSKSATMLQLTNKPIIDIALLYGFATPQYYTRVFKQYFNESPSSFRCRGVNASQHLFPHHMVFDEEYSLELTRICEQSIVGEVLYLNINLDRIKSYAEISKYCLTHVRNYLKWFAPHRDVLAESPSKLKTVIDFNSIENGGKGIIKVKYLIAISDCATVNAHHELMTIKAGKYAKISYIGSWSGYEGFSSKAYAYILPNHNLTRSNGVDHETFHIFNSDDEIVHCDYYIPIN
ncbi:helix-turn-helix domain-containing protein [Yersinia ruckeri]|uniref:helix-turn-helix domain-containing protein n=1 Tax=Yersinia ruckeri TaxID=29486 RepID=UPI002237BAFC|nr:helix-turn-helix domain-containing protein [Yersinia ruckeri]MCW6569460.1 helix-turn-helix domain-containing protein [Yersinia ruckeri]